MRWVKEWISRLSIRKKLIFYSYVIVTPILLLICCLLFYRNYKTAAMEEEENTQQSIKRLSDSIEVLQKNIMRMGTYICINTEITKLLTAENADELNLDAQVWYHQAPMQIIQDMMALDGTMKTIAVYPENGVTPYLKCMDYSAYIGETKTVWEQDIYRLAAEKKGKYLWQRVGKYESDTYRYNRTDKIVMYRLIYDLARQNKLGYLVIGSSAEIFEETCANALSNPNESIVVVSEFGTELLRCGNVSDAVVSDILNRGFAEALGKNGIGGYNYEGYRVHLRQSDETGTVIYKIIPKVTIGDFAETIMVVPLALLFGFLIGLYPVLVLVSRIVTKPLGDLCVAMARFKKGDFEQKIAVRTYDEVGEVTACFNSMVDDIKELIDKNYVMALKEKESEIATLQAQINPHFLYNTLDSLYWKAVECGNEEIGEDIISLSSLFRLVLNRGKGIVTVRTEMELLEQYLHIQKMRFGKRLEYRFDVDPSILEEALPKLILQPFVENAVVHGFEKGENEYSLTIIGKRENEYMTFLIIDTGVGMTKEQLISIWEEPDTKKYASQRIGRYAIKNVKERLELLYKEKYSLSIESQTGLGTTVKLQIPYGLEEA